MGNLNNFPVWDQLSNSILCQQSDQHDIINHSYSHIHIQEQLLPYGPVLQFSIPFLSDPTILFNQHSWIHIGYHNSLICKKIERNKFVICSKSLLCKLAGEA